MSIEELEKKVKRLQDLVEHTCSTASKLDLNFVEALVIERLTPEIDQKIEDVMTEHYEALNTIRREQKQVLLKYLTERRVQEKIEMVIREEMIKAIKKALIDVEVKLKL